MSTKAFFFFFNHQCISHIQMGCEPKNTKRGWVGVGGTAWFGNMNDHANEQPWTWTIFSFETDHCHLMHNDLYSCCEESVNHTNSNTIVTVHKGFVVVVFAWICLQSHHCSSGKIIKQTTVIANEEKKEEKRGNSVQTEQSTRTSTHVLSSRSFDNSKFKLSYDLLLFYNHGDFQFRRCIETLVEGQIYRKLKGILYFERRTFASRYSHREPYCNQTWRRLMGFELSKMPNSTISPNNISTGTNPYEK